MKVLLLASASNPHTEKWANLLVNNNIDIYLVSLHEFTCEFDKRIKCIKLKGKPGFGYVYGVFHLNKIIKEIKPDIINSHYASGYGTLASLTGFKRILLSLWGSDILIFPKKTIIHKKIIEFNIKMAAGVASTSNGMLLEAKKICPIKYSYITPFGIDTNIFKANHYKSYKKEFVIGTVKSLKKVYGIDILLIVFSKLLKVKPEGIDLKLVIIGDGVEKERLIDLSNDLDINKYVFFKGNVKNKDVPYELNKMDLFCSFSRSESFGVSALEASSCGIPVITSNAIGFQETVVDQKTGYFFSIDNINGIVDTIIDLILNYDKRIDMGSNGIEYVKSNYEIYNSFILMNDAYNDILMRIEK